MPVSLDSEYEKIVYILKRSRARGHEVLSRERAESILRENGRDGDLEKALQNVGEIDLKKNEAFSERFLGSVRMAYGPEVILSMIITHNPEFGCWEQLCVARQYLYSDKNEAVITSGGQPYDSDGDLD